MKIAIVTDSNSGITQEEAQKLGIFVLPMPMLINGDTYYEGTSMTQEKFYELLSQDADVSTSQPNIEDLTEFWTNILRDHDEIVHIPMSSGLSGSCATAEMLAKDFDGKVTVVDNHRISVTLRSCVWDAIELVKEGKSASEIKKILEEYGEKSSIYIMVDTMKYLKKGGRVTPTAAMIGTVLNIKPVLQIQGGALDAYAKVRGNKAAVESMLDAVRKDLSTRFKSSADNGRVKLFVAHSNNEEEAREFAKTIEKTFEGLKVASIDPLSLSVACHIGSGSLAVGCTEDISD